ncbi:MAG: hypothetical protein KBE16_07150 [Alphaproteobacteria bacterium]|jgi:hypothetical protein|nr:hypothetical protein [Alphaproteobacteria bacterium]MBP9877882.1 hypothetical protein [Alphaproteobacteria bacterium]
MNKKINSDIDKIDHPPVSRATRKRNFAMLWGLLAMVALFYVVAMFKVSQHF